jgi:uncharacterized protein (DUF885 family)
MKRLFRWGLAESGNKFDLSHFQDRVLTGGDMPMALLEQGIRPWIEEEKKR